MSNHISKENIPWHNMAVGESVTVADTWVTAHGLANNALKLFPGTEVVEGNRRYTTRERRFKARRVRANVVQLTRIA